MLRPPLGLALATLVLGGCARSPAPLFSPPSPSVPAAAATAARPTVPPLAGVPTSAPAPTTGNLIAAEPEPPPPAPEVEPEPEPSVRVAIEPPYSPLGHPRLGTEMATLERDEELFQWALGGSSAPQHPGNRPGYHPATRVVVDVRLLSRAPVGSTKRVERIARSSGYWPLRACFEQAQRLSPRSERAARVRLSLGATGKLLGARLMEAPAEREYGRCVLERLRKLDFTPGFSRKLDVEISVKQWPGHAPVPPRAPEDAPRLRASDALRASLEALRPALGACYRARLERDRGLWGRLALRLELDGDASVRGAREVETRFPDPAMVECARQAVLGARLAPSESRELTLGLRFAQGVAGAPPSLTGAPPAPAPASPVSGAPPAPPSLPPAPPAPAPPAPLPPAPVH